MSDMETINQNAANTEVSEADKPYLTAFQIITVAGTARSRAMEAIERARHFDFTAAVSLLEQAKVEYLKSHEIQTELLTAEAQGNRYEVNIIMVHAQDHLSMANMAMENAAEFIHLYRVLAELKHE